MMPEKTFAPGGREPAPDLIRGLGLARANIALLCPAMFCYVYVMTCYVFCYVML